MISGYRNSLILMVAGLLLISCKKEESKPFANPTQIDAYFPVSDFLEEKIKKIEGVTVTKIIQFNEESEEVRFKPDQEAWRKELDFFFQADINKAAFATAYSTTEEEGLLVHRLKPGEKGTIKEIRVQKKGELVESIHIITVNDNLFYHSEVSGKIGLDAQEDLATYRLSGNQKVWFMAPTLLKVNAEIE
ncbi:hypothetical protein [Cyclobacterium jeungdonense]|uniref:Lipoprotein n=1 Tax=Cyclobacterium jeungdonense TaxID=708087 RepID=A0ABT8C845_9BACT|nr:hypothetical protein [Cyclobacterium jeungdonense]MDN3687993.1 hypothetical protein [Cyclobacterium jeungdonense]